ncbi:MAG: hypothetical protein H6529_15805 [Nocardioides sp.]|nr:hypothetical protein [Nocardioidaceae bacterium]MCB8957931.1 hypothetical protein [Nocardioides sp.]
MRRAGGRRRCQRIDHALLALVRLVCDGRWSVEAAGAQLRAEVPDDLALRGARARVTAAVAGRPSILGERSVAILDVAIAAGSTGREVLPARVAVEMSPTC